MTTFSNPYESTPLPDLRTVQILVHKDDKALIKGTRAEPKTEVICLTILYKRLCDALREANIDDYTKADQLEEFVVGLKLVGPKKRKVV